MKDVLVRIDGVYQGQNFQGHLLLGERMVKDAIRGKYPRYHAWTRIEVVVMLFLSALAGFFGGLFVLQYLLATGWLVIAGG